jgi:hypothetical protein
MGEAGIFAPETRLELIEGERSSRWRLSGAGAPAR